MIEKSLDLTGPSCALFVLQFIKVITSLGKFMQEKRGKRVVHKYQILDDFCPSINLSSRERGCSILSKRDQFFLTGKKLVNISASI